MLLLKRNVFPQMSEFLPGESLNYAEQDIIGTVSAVNIFSEYSEPAQGNNKNGI